jgi:pilus assembly protein CpaD
MNQFQVLIQSGRWRRVRVALSVAALAAVLAGCVTEKEAYAPSDYRNRHAIAIKESNRTVEVFVGSARGRLTPTQRAEVAGLAHVWKRESTGGIVVDTPVGTPNQVAAADNVREIRSIFTAVGVPPHAVSVRPYRPVDPVSLATIKLNYSKMSAEVGPCGLWPQDVGPSLDRTYNENRPYWNHGCANQRNLAAMVAEPADLVQPRTETAVYTPRRTTVVEKYRAGLSPSTIHTSNTSKDGKISNVGQ